MILKCRDNYPQIHESVYVAPSADIIGEVEIGKDSSVWFNTVIRGDLFFIKIGERTNIQDCSVLHIARDKENKKGIPVIIGNDVTIGHSVIVHACEIKDACLIGMGATILDESIIGTESIVGANSLVTKGKIFPPRSLILGSPAKLIRELTEDEVLGIYKSAKYYLDYKKYYIK